MTENSKELKEWLEYIETKYRPRCELGLERISKVANKLNLTEFTCPVITVAGTNGKGSSIACLQALALASGLRVGTYTSPHLIRFNERIKVNGIAVADDILCEAFTVIDDSVDVVLTYFEFVTLAALYIFQQQDLDLILLEVGLGGRLDAVNIVDPDISIITTIALDHVDVLGDNREKIGSEKAGIMRPKTPVVIGDFDPPQSIKNRADALQAPAYFIKQQFNYENKDDFWDWQYDEIKLSDLPVPQIPMQNAATALMAFYLLRRQEACCFDRIDEFFEIANKALKDVKLIGRFQRFSDPVEVIVDVAHNPQSSEYLAKQLTKKYCGGKTLAVIGMLKDKDLKNTLKPMLKVVDAWYLADLQGPRAAKAKELQEVLQTYNESCYTHADVIAAYRHAILDSKPEDRIVVFGSFYTVGDVLKHRGL